MSKSVTDALAGLAESKLSRLQRQIEVLQQELKRFELLQTDRAEDREKVTSVLDWLRMSETALTRVFTTLVD